MNISTLILILGGALPTLVVTKVRIGK